MSPSFFTTGLPTAGQKFPTIFREIFAFFFAVFKNLYLFIYFYSTIYRKTSHDVLRNPGRETLA